LRTWIFVVLSVGLAGCGGGLGGTYMDRMTPDQIAQATKDKNLTMSCLVANTPYGRGIHVFVNLDKQVLPPNSSFSNDEQCKIVITTGAPPK